MSSLSDLKQLQPSTPLSTFCLSLPLYNIGEIVLIYLPGLFYERQQDNHRPSLSTAALWSSIWHKAVHYGFSSVVSFQCIAQLSGLFQIYPDGVPEDQLMLLDYLSRLYSTDEIGKWNVTSSDTLAALLNPENGVWKPAQVMYQ